MPLHLIRSDITQMKVDAIVNAANPSLLGGGGVDGAIHRAAGPQLLEECRMLGGCRTGEAKLSRGYDLPCEYIIHTVGPVWDGGGHGEREQLASCYRSSLELACEMDFRTLAFPLISTGAYGYPKQEAMHVAIDTIAQFLLTHEMTVYLVLFTGDAFQIGGRLFQDIASYIDDVYVAEHDEDDAFKRLRYLEALRQERLAETVFGQDTQWNTAATSVCPKVATPPAELDDMLRQMDAGFAETLLRWIDEKGMTDAECYKRANIDRRLFNKLKNHPDYRPSKPTALAFAIALRLNLAQTRDLISRAGYALTRSSKSDIVVEYCILHHEYDIFEINAVLFDMDLQPLGG